MPAGAVPAATQRPKATLVALCQATSHPDRTHGPLGTICQIQLTLQGRGRQVHSLSSGSKAKIGLAGSAFLNCLGMGEEGARCQSFSFYAAGQNSPSQVPKSTDKSKE